MPPVPIRIVPDSPALPALAMSMLLEPVVRFLPGARAEGDVGRSGGVAQRVEAGGDVVVAGRVGEQRVGADGDVVVAGVLAFSALSPAATLLLPVVLANSALVPVATLSWPVVLENSAS